MLDDECFAAITDVLGGVTVNNERAFTPITLPDTRFPQGEVTLNGEEALAYVRERMAFASGDFQRVRNQQAYVKGLAAKILDTNVIADSQRIKALFEAVRPYFAFQDGETRGPKIPLRIQVLAAFIGSRLWLQVCVVDALQLRSHAKP